MGYNFYPQKMKDTWIPMVVGDQVGSFLFFLSPGISLGVELWNDESPSFTLEETFTTWKLMGTLEDLGGCFFGGAFPRFLLFLLDLFEHMEITGTQRAFIPPMFFSLEVFSEFSERPSCDVRCG